MVRIAPLSHPRHARAFAYLLLVPSTLTCTDKASSCFPASGLGRSGMDSRSVFGLVLPTIVSLGRGWCEISGAQVFKSWFRGWQNVHR